MQLRREDRHWQRHAACSLSHLKHSKYLFQIWFCSDRSQALQQYKGNISSLPFRLNLKSCGYDYDRACNTILILITWNNPRKFKRLICAVKIKLIDTGNLGYILNGPSKSNLSGNTRSFSKKSHIKSTAGLQFLHGFLSRRTGIVPRIRNLKNAFGIIGNFQISLRRSEPM